ncbi:FANCI solenoid 4-domain-containing protein [Absidia repens]|uniref:FANCI solenoid 4-domain-containing protein n=1 Tax=Absidia repens TaxID=90262 RepID=A0A1X2I6R2_9FUNG|nr:FANCI solenoid 4-domain-containing protein [Absidia repens]
MDRKILNLAKQPNRTALREYVKGLTEDQIEELVRSSLLESNNTKTDPVLTLRGILYGDPNGIQTRLVLTRVIIEWMGTETEATNGAGIKNKLANASMNLILPEIEILAPSMLEEIADRVLHFIESNVPVQPRVFEILSKAYNLLSALEANDRAIEILNKLCESNWHPQSAIGLTHCINEMELSTPQLNQVIKRMLTQLKKLEIEEVPPFIYQLLLLSRKGNKRNILSGICEYFDWLHTTVMETDTSRMEGTVMLHISFAIKQDQELGTELVKYIKSDKALLLEKFKMACLLSAARIHRLEDTIFDLLKQNIISVYKDTDKISKYSWISEYSKIDSDSVRQVIMEVTDKSASGWDQVIQSLTQLAMILIDTASAQTSLRTPGQSLRSKKPKAGPMDHVIALGIDVLLKMFKLHDIARIEILEQITSRVVSRSTSSLHFLDLLEKLTTNCPYEVEKYINNIKDTLDYLSLLSHSTAKKLLSAIQTVSFSNYQFRDGLILVLRKSMFSRELDSRMIAVNGFLSLLQNQLGSNDNSNNNHTSTSVQIQSIPGVAFEILGLLRRCFSQQCEVRVAVYAGLGSLAERYEVLSGDVFEVLYTQFLRSYEIDDSVVTPLRISDCVENGIKSRLLEPVHLLLVNLLKTVRSLKNGGYHSVITEALATCKNHLKSLTFRLTKLDIEDYELDKTTNFDTTTSTGLRSSHFAEILLGTFDTIMENEFISDGDSVESCQTILTLFKKRKALLGLLKENTSKDKGRKLSSIGSSSLLSLEFSAKISQALFLHTDRQSPLLTLRSDIGFMHYIVSVTPTILAAAIDNENDYQDDKYFGHCVDLVKVYMHILIHEDSDSSFINHQPQKGQSLLGAITTSLKYILEITCNVWPTRLPDLLSQLRTMSTALPSSGSINEVISDLLNEFKEILNKYLNTRPPLYKESANIIQIIQFLANQMDSAQDDFTAHANSIIDWLTQTAEERPIEDHGVVKEIFGLLIHFCEHSNQLDAIRDLAQDVHNIHGEIDIDEDSQADPSIKYQMINPKTYGIATTLILNYAEQENDGMTWSIGRLKISGIKCNNSTKKKQQSLYLSFSHFVLASSEDLDQHHQFEQVVCQRLISYVTIISELIRAILMGSQAEHLIKVLTKTYRTFTVFMKYKMATQYTEISQEFINLVASIGSQVTTKMYTFLTTFAHQQQGDYDQSGGTRKKKGKKKEVNAKEKAKILREAKMIPLLIFVVEQFERHLIQLTRKSKVDLMQYMKRSTSRDFQIKLDNYVESEEDSSDDAKNPKRPLQPDDDENDNSDGDNDDGEQAQVIYSDSDEDDDNAGGRKRARI